MCVRERERENDGGDIKGTKEIVCVEIEVVTYVRVSKQEEGEAEGRAGGEGEEGVRAR